jgi:uncharacterized membrane protein SpoIIM required for sporulation
VTPPVLRRLIGANALLVAGAVACGAVLGTMDGRRVVLPSSVAAPSPDIPGSTLQIVRQNGRVWLFVCTTLASFGVAGAGLLAANAFRFGVDVATVGLSVPGELTFLAAHGLLEFAAFTLAVAAVQYLGWMLFALLASGCRTGRLSIGLTALLGSGAVGLLAAWVEALSHAARTAGAA